ncbi:hypothetical protein Tco_1016943 [Tanacetum coccineum]|uniref:26S proteasome non-ATPase regulatory subunit 1/RPN2 N-terminal domain-containing protein n=1 Tax=Tanacetum coccineum TaxID=301880 RepID=A0ABQ5FRG2_9ASTR
MSGTNRLDAKIFAMKLKSMVRYFLGELKESLSYALKVGNFFDSYEDSDYTRTLLDFVLHKLDEKEKEQFTWEKNIQYVAFPAKSCDVFGYPFDEASSLEIMELEIALNFEIGCVEDVQTSCFEPLTVQRRKNTCLEAATKSYGRLEWGSSDTTDAASSMPTDSEVIQQSEAVVISKKVSAKEKLSITIYESL